MSAISTHVLDAVRLEHLGAGKPSELGRRVTDADGRIADFGVASLAAGTYRLTFETGAYLRSAGSGEEAFFPEVAVTFRADGTRPTYHVPLLLSPYSYSTYRGS
jgi:5-hydroxyisourate hydrolase